MKAFYRHCLPQQYFNRLCVTIAAVLALLFVNHGLFSGFAYAQSNIPANYSCGTPSNGHCYAIYIWQGAMNGAEVNIGVPFLQSYHTDGFSNWEYWVGQYGNSKCSGEGNDCWVEAGMSDEVGGSSGTYFWADSRPNGGYNVHYPWQIGPDDENVTFQIYRVNSTTWNVNAHVNACGYPNSCTPDWGGQSTANSFSPTVINIGMELAGTYGQPRIASDWTNNYWRCGSSWCPQNGYGNSGSGPKVTGPMTGYWNVPPSKTSTGDWFAYCSSC